MGSVNKQISFRDKRVLVTGGGGFMAHHLVNTLLKYGSKINLMYHHEPNIVPPFRYFVGDIEDKEYVEKCVKISRPHHVFHLAIAKERSFESDYFLPGITTNLIGTLNLFLSLEKQTELDSVVIAGTIDEYGQSSGPLTENHKEKPTGAYAFSKYCVSKLSEVFAASYGLPLVMLRISLVYGPYQNIDMFLPAMIKALLNNQHFPMTLGQQTRDYIYIDDLMDAFVLASLNKSIVGEYINIGYGESVQISDIALMTQELLGKNGLIQLGKIDYRENEIMEVSVDISKAKHLLNWEPKMNLHDGLLSAIRFYQECLET